jgi:hypothetical protein
MLRTMERLVELDPPNDSPEGKLLSNLADALGEYEKRYFPFREPTAEELKAWRESELRGGDDAE